jgi:hypothetical protein
MPQKVNTSPSAASPPAPPLKKESPILPPQTLPPRPSLPPQPQQQVRQGSPLKNQIIASPSKSPPSLRPAPPKSAPPLAANKDTGIPLTDWARTPQVPPLLPANNSRTMGIQGSNLRPSVSTPVSTPQVTPSRTAVITPATSQENGVRQPLHNIMLNSKRERSLTLIPLITLSTPTQLASPAASSTSTSSSPQPASTGLLLSITSPPPPSPSTQTICLTVSKDTPELILNAYLTKDLTLHGSYTFTVSSNGRKLAPSIWPDASRRSGTTDSIAVAPRGTPLPTPTTNSTSAGILGDTWRFGLVLGEPGSITTIEAGCTAFLKRDERGLLVRGERSRTGQAAGEDGGELERVVILVLRGR